MPPAADPPRRLLGGVAPELLAGLLAAAAYCLGQVLAGRYPFGELTRNVNDTGTQFMPMHALFRDILTGRATGDMWFNWSSALGVPFLAEYAAYLSSPLSLLVVLFPRHQVDLAMFAIFVAHLAVAAAVFTRYLRTISAGPTLPAAAIGAAYATCGWAIDDAGYIPMWLGGLVAFPLLALVGEWAIAGRRPLLGPVLVALAWWANFYTAYMAMIGAGLLLLARLVSAAPGWRAGMASVGRLLRTAIAGVLLAAPLLVPTLMGNAGAETSGGRFLNRATMGHVLAPDPADLFARALPGTSGVGVAPGWYLALPVLLLAAMFPWSRRIPGRVRLVHSAALLAVGVSLFWFPSHIAWHGFDVPDGSEYRQAFVVCGWLAVLAWLTISRTRPDALAFAGGFGSLALIWLLAQGSGLISTWTAPALAVSAVAMLVALVAWRWTGRIAVLGVVVVVVVVAESALTAAVVARAHDTFAKRPVWGAEHDAIRSALLQADRWPATRTTPGAPAGARSRWRAPNEPMLLGGQGAGYYSSLMPEVTTDALRGLGINWAGFGRALYDTPDPVRDALVGIGARVERSDPGPVHVIRRPGAPLVAARDLPAGPEHPFLRRNELAGAVAYQVPDVTVTRPDGGTAEPDEDGYRLAEVLTEPGVRLAATCPRGSRVHLWAPTLTGSARLADGPWQPLLPVGARDPGRVSGAGPVDLGVTPSGAVDVEVLGGPETLLPSRPIGCLDEAVLAAGVEELRRSGAAVSTTGHSFTAHWDSGVDGSALALVTAADGWRCSTGDGWREPEVAAGFIAVPMGGARELRCEFRPPGLRAGLLTGATTLVILLGGRALAGRRRPG